MNSQNTLTFYNALDNNSTDEPIEDVTEEKPYYINKFQKKVIDTYYLTADEFKERAWFNNRYHWRALRYLIQVKHMNVYAALDELTGLNAEEAYGIYRELSKEEVINLTKNQIDSMIKFGLSKEEVNELDEYQLQAYIKLKNKGITSAQIQQQNWIQSKYHVMALGYLLTVKKMKFNEACLYLSTLAAIQALAVCYDIPKTDFGLDRLCLETLIEARKFEGLRTKTQLFNIDNKIQIEIIKDLYFWGIDGNVINNNKFLNTKEQHKALLYLITECFVYYKEAIEIIKELADYQLVGIQHGLSAQEIKELKPYQMDALIKCKTAQNQLSAETFQNQDWFNSDDHVYAFCTLLSNHFSVERAMIELNGLSANEAQKIAKGESRDNIIGLNPYMMKAVEQYKLHGMTGALLRDKQWFNSDLHVHAVGALIKNHANCRIEEKSILTLARMNDAQLTLLVNGFTLERLKKLSPVQITILTNSNRKYYFMDKDKIEKATCLKTDKQYAIFDLLYDKVKDQDKILEVLNFATQKNLLDNLLNQLKNDQAVSQLKNYQEIINGLGLNASKKAPSSYGAYFYNFFNYLRGGQPLVAPENPSSLSLSSIKYGGIVE